MFYKVISILRRYINGHKLVVVVEADEDLSLELLPLDAEQAALLLAPKPAWWVHHCSGWVSLRHFIEELKSNLLHNRPRVFLDLLTKVGLLSSVFSMSRRTTG